METSEDLAQFGRRGVAMIRKLYPPCDGSVPNNRGLVDVVDGAHNGDPGLSQPTRRLDLTGGDKLRAWRAHTSNDTTGHLVDDVRAVTDQRRFRGWHTGFLARCR
ncbi:hypothetical protein ACFSVJ_21905 [Prauserella oleivorans]